MTEAGTYIQLVKSLTYPEILPPGSRGWVIAEIPEAHSILIKWDAGFNTYHYDGFGDTWVECVVEAKS